MNAIAAEQFRALRTLAVWRRPHHAALALRGIDRRALRRWAAIGGRHGLARRRLGGCGRGRASRACAFAEQLSAAGGHALEFAVEHAAFHDGIKDESAPSVRWLERLYKGRRVM